MTAVIWKLREDHRNLARILSLVKREIEEFERGVTPDYPLIEDILDYLSNYPEHCHHPVEDMVLAKLRERDPDAAKTVGDLDGEHARLSHRLDRFSVAIQTILNDETVPRDWFAKTARDFHDGQLHHMQMEEVLFFPPAIRALTYDDWQDIETNMRTADDPLFGGETDTKYKSLLKEIMEAGKDSAGDRVESAMRAAAS